MVYEKIFMIDEMTYLNFGNFIEQVKAKYSDEKIIGYSAEKKLNKEGKIEAVITFSKNERGDKNEK